LVVYGGFDARVRPMYAVYCADVMFILFMIFSYNSASTYAIGALPPLPPSRKNHDVALKSTAFTPAKFAVGTVEFQLTPL
jgi:hypothetical protein